MMSDLLFRCRVVALFVVGALVVPVRGQAQAAPVGTAAVAATSFEVASVKMVSEETLRSGGGVPTVCTYPTARFYMHNASIVTIMVQAYGTDGRRVEKRPEWGDSQLYDIDATVDGEKPLTHEQMMPLLQHLLEQRFHLKTHLEMRTLSGYEMVVGKDGAKLKAEDAKARPGDMPAVFHGYLAQGHLQGWGLTMERLAHMLVSPVGQPVVDKTGLTGAYDVDLKYRESADEDSSLASVFTAVQEQLGLKLVAAKLTLDYLVIDHVDKVPTEN